MPANNNLSEKNAGANSHRRKYLKDYRPPGFWIRSCELFFDLDPQNTRVKSRLQIERNRSLAKPAGTLFLNSQVKQITSVKLDHQVLSETEWQLNGEFLEIPIPSELDQFSLEIENTIEPAANTALEGLYISGGKFCTQNEAEGFRRITPYLDRPDVMATFRVHIRAPKNEYPYLLSNGNRIAHEDLPDGLHSVSWEDPFPKPCYLFALVAGKLGLLQDQFQTASGRIIDLEIYTDPGNEKLARHAMQSLKHAMRWDEDTFGLQYDLDLYMIVAVMDFNMGAMENKGLNIFNAKLVLADQKSATDEMFESIEAVIAHEYFHNWTGNRITCRDWFQLSLKEGLTVYRDQRFTADRTDPAVKRIKDVQFLRASQFAEDAGPLRHPVQPDQYVEINNFYTLTVYEKGAEIVRLIASLIGEDRFARGITEYFRLYDGQAVTIDEFLHAMAQVSDLDTAQFRRWYKLAGTPVVQIQQQWDAHQNQLKLKIRQLIDSQHVEPPLLIPIKLGFLNQSGESLAFESGHADLKMLSPSEAQLELKTAQTEVDFKFTNQDSEPILSVLRGFSAPVKLERNIAPEHLALLYAHDPDPFARFDAGQSLMEAVFLRELARKQSGQSETDVREIEVAFAQLLELKQDVLYTAYTLQLPALAHLIALQAEADIENSIAVYESMRHGLARTLETTWQATFRLAQENSSLPDKAGRAWRKMKATSLFYLAALGADSHALLYESFQSATNMTDELSAFSLLCDQDCPERSQAISEFRSKWDGNDLVLDYWFAVQASAYLPDTLTQIEQLQSDPAFRITNPNKVRSLYASLGRNIDVLHQADGAAYRFLADKIIELNPVNPAMAAALTRAYSRFTNLDRRRKELIKTELQRIVAQNKLSSDVYEIATSILDSRVVS